MSTDGAQVAKIKNLLKALEMARAALEHDAPSECWATGPLTGDPILDLMICPGCQAIKEIDAVLPRKQSEAS